MKLVLDTDVVVAAFRSPAGGSAELLRLADEQMCQIVVSVALMLEYESVILRPEHLEAANATLEQAEVFLKALANLAEPVQVDYRWRPQTRDPGDEMVLEAAINASADVLVTFNKRDFGTAPAQFGIACLRPGEVLESTK